MADIIYLVAAGVALAAVLIAFIRMIKGPSAADRAVALDVMTIISISLIAFLSMFLGRGIYLDIALVYGLISFIGVLAIARYLERGL